MNKKVINIINETEDLDYTVNDETLIINHFNENPQDIHINIKAKDNSLVVINYVAIVKKDTTIDINGLIEGNNNRLVINVRVVGENNHANVNVSVKAQENTKDNEIIEDLKGINENGTVTLLPILEIDTNEVNASHFATVGSFSENELFYLQSKGLSLETALFLLKKSFIYNLFSDEFINMLNNRREKDE